MNAPRSAPHRPNAAPSWRHRLYDAYVSSGQAAARPHVPASRSPEAVFSPFAPQMRRFVRAHMPADRSVRIVDLGCGDGMLVHFLLEAGYAHVRGVDASLEQVARAHQLGLFEVAHGDIGAFLASHANESIDVVLLVDVLEHLTRDELFEVLDAVARVLRPGGLCVAHVPNAEGLYGMRVRYGDLTHEQAFTARSMAQVFRTVGFGVVSAAGDTPIVHGAVSLVRRGVWALGTLPHRILLAAETGTWNFILTQNLVVRAIK